MIIKGNKRGHGKELANHLMNARDNEHVELFDGRHRPKGIEVVRAQA